MLYGYGLNFLHDHDNDKKREENRCVDDNYTNDQTVYWNLIERRISLWNSWYKIGNKPFFGDKIKEK